MNQHKDNKEQLTSIKELEEHYKTYRLGSRAEQWIETFNRPLRFGPNRNIRVDLEFLIPWLEVYREVDKLMDKDIMKFPELKSLKKTLLKSCYELTKPELMKRMKICAEYDPMGYEDGVYIMSTQLAPWNLVEEKV